MEIKILQENENSMKFLIKGVPTAFANALRRIMIAEVPTMAIEDVIILENSSLMYDEVLAHRLGLIPLTTDLKGYVLPEECECKSELGCNKCRASFTLEAEAKEGPITVYSGDLKPQDPAVRPVSENIPVLKLAPGQKIKLEAYAKLGRGVKHAKWQPVSACAYKYVPKVSIDLKRCDGCGECVKFCPKNVLKLEGGKVSVKNELNCTLCLECVKRCPKKKPPISVSWKEGEFIFYIESTGALHPRSIVGEAAKIIGRKAEKLIEVISHFKA
ncbi:TPA: DNA-directed RNA polymerase subunit D [Candidatus Bathyarchaeota archaeon]|nr:DNA-directed RNA polymerase subunit D [Candidatus Bathyarchaeota archaeon]